MSAVPAPSARYADCATATGTVCAPNTRPNAPNARAETVSTDARLTAVRRRGAARMARQSAAGIPAFGIESGQDPVLHRATQQVDLRGRGTAHFDVLRANPVEVLPGGRVRDAELHRHELQRQPRRVEVQHVAFAPAELRLREVAIGLDRARPLDVVQR